MRPADYEQALEAARRWIAEHGRYPQQREWEYQAPGRPTTRTFKRRWGWEELMRKAAGLGPFFYRYSRPGGLSASQGG
jgi:hypothetical protein